MKTNVRKFRRPAAARIQVPGRYSTEPVAYVREFDRLNQLKPVKLDWRFAEELEPMAEAA